MRTSCLAVLLTLLSAHAFAESQQARIEQVRQREIAFAQTMADRDFAAFGTFLADDAIFFGDRVTRGKSEVMQAWKAFYDGKTAPFSWKPDSVEVLESGTLALSSGPVINEIGEPIGQFNSVWQRNAAGEWHVVFDKGCRVCRCKQEKT